MEVPFIRGRGFNGRVARLCISALLILLALGCASNGRVYPGQAPDLPPDHGFLLVHVESPVTLRWLRTNTGLSLWRTEPGSQIVLLTAPAGRHRWANARVEARMGGFRLRSQFEFEADDDYWAFDVEAGKINYPGHFVVRTRKSVWGGVTASIENRSSQVYPRLEKAFPVLAKRHPVVYSGRARDRFLAYVTQLKAGAGPDEAPPRSTPPEGDAGRTGD